MELPLRPTIIALILLSFALVPADDNPYGVSSPTVSDTSKKIPEPAAAKDSATVQKKTSAMDTVSAIKSVDTTATQPKLKKKTKKSSKTVSKNDSTAVKSSKDSV